MSKIINILISSIFIVLITITSSLFSSCSVEESKSSTDVQKEILEAYLMKYYPNIKPEENGLYILKDDEGDVDIKCNQFTTCYPIVHYSILGLDKTYQSSNFEDVAKQLGTFSPFNYYGPRVWTYGNSSLSVGLERMLSDMKVGGRRTAIIPAWLSSDKVDYEMYESTGSTYIYDVKLDTLVENISNYQTDLLKDFSEKYYEGMKEDSVRFYYKFLSSGKSEKKLTDGDAISIWYVGKLLNGYVFDTNIKDTAIKYDIYTSSPSTYKPLSYKHYVETNDAYKENSFVHGFTKTINRLNYGDEAITFFDSDLGYKEKGKFNKNAGVPPYAPMFYYIKVLTEDEEEENK